MVTSFLNFEKEKVFELKYNNKKNNTQQTTRISSGLLCVIKRLASKFFEARQNTDNYNDSAITRTFAR